LKKNKGIIIVIALTFNIYSVNNIEVLLHFD